MLLPRFHCDHSCLHSHSYSHSVCCYYDESKEIKILRLSPSHDDSLPDSLAQTSTVSIPCFSVKRSGCRCREQRDQSFHQTRNQRQSSHSASVSLHTTTLRLTKEYYGAGVAITRLMRTVEGCATSLVSAYAGCSSHCLTGREHLHPKMVTPSGMLLRKDAVQEQTSNGYFRDTTQAQDTPHKCRVQT